MGWAKFQEDILDTKDDNAILNKEDTRTFISKVIAPQRYKNGYTKYNSIKKRVQIYVEGEVSEDALKELQKWNYHPQKKFWSHSCASKKKIKMYLDVARKILS